MLRCAVSAARSLVAGIAIVFGGLILFVGIFVSKQRRDYALKAARCVTDMVATLSGPPNTKNDPKKPGD
jgi:hypothetical protein